MVHFVFCTVLWHAFSVGHVVEGKLFWLEREMTGLWKTYSRLIQSTTRAAFHVTQSSHFNSKPHDSVRRAISFAVNTGKTTGEAFGCYIFRRLSLLERKPELLGCTSRWPSASPTHSSFSRETCTDWGRQRSPSLSPDFFEQTPSHHYFIFKSIV